MSSGSKVEKGAVAAERRLPKNESFRARINAAFNNLKAVDELPEEYGYDTTAAFDLDNRDPNIRMQQRILASSALVSAFNRVDVLDAVLAKETSDILGDAKGKYTVYVKKKIDRRRAASNER